MSKNNTLYKAYLEKKKAKRIKNKMLKKYNISDSENIIIIDNRKRNLVLLVWDVVCRSLKIIFYLGIAILITIGATVLLNIVLRKYIINF